MQNLINFNQLVQKIMSANEILTIAKITLGYDHVVNWRKLTYSNPNVDLVSVNGCAKLGQIPSIRLILSGNEIFSIIKGHYSVVNFAKQPLDMVKVNAYAKVDLIQSICSQDIERKQNFNKYQGDHSVVIWRVTIQT